MAAAREPFGSFNRGQRLGWMNGWGAGLVIGFLVGAAGGLAEGPGIPAAMLAALALLYVGSKIGGPR